MDVQKEISTLRNQAALLRYATLAVFILFCMTLAGYYGYGAGRAAQVKKDNVVMQAWSHSTTQGVKNANT